MFGWLLTISPNDNVKGESNPTLKRRIKMGVVYLFDIKKRTSSQPLRSIPNILEHRLANMWRAGNGEKIIEFWDTVPELLKMVKQYAKKENKTMFESKEAVELILTVGAVKGVEYGY